MRVIIRQLQASDLSMMASSMTPAELSIQRDRWEEQERGEISYLTAWVGDDFAGNLKIRWAGSVHEQVRRQFPAVPEFRRLKVEPAMQGMGIGTKLLAAAEALVAQQGFYFAGLCVGINNEGARRLYERHGYFDWSRGVFDSHWTQLLPDGTSEARSHEVTYMTKALSTQRRAIA